MFDRLINKETRSESMQQLTQSAATTTPKPLNAFSKFVKDNYHSVKKDKGLSNNQQIMKELGVLFKQMSTNENN
jgi:hypothetical protein